MRRRFLISRIGERPETFLAGPPCEAVEQRPRHRFRSTLHAVGKSPDHGYYPAGRWDHILVTTLFLCTHTVGDPPGRCATLAILHGSKTIGSKYYPATEKYFGQEVILILCPTLSYSARVATPILNRTCPALRGVRLIVK